MMALVVAALRLAGRRPHHERAGRNHHHLRAIAALLEQLSRLPGLWLAHRVPLGRWFLDNRNHPDERNCNGDSPHIPTPPRHGATHAKLAASSVLPEPL